jgi:predicted nucleic acid-binding protein
MNLAGASKPSFVLDCSVSAHWVFSGETDMAGDAYALGLLDRMQSTAALVPSFWHVEMASMFRKGAQQGRLRIDPREFMQRLDAFDIRTDLAQPDAGAIAELSQQCGASAYDAAYLHLCQRLRLPLATLDKRLKPCAARAQVKLFELN